MLKVRIKNFVDTNYEGSYRFLKEKLIKKTFGNDAFNTIMQSTTFLDQDAPMSLRIHCYMGDITTHPTCKMCSNQVVFNSNKGWLTYCSNECRFKDYDYIQDKKRATNIQKYGATNVLASRHVLDKRKHTSINNAMSIVVTKSTSSETTTKPYLNEDNLEIFIKKNITANYLRNRRLPESNTTKKYDFILPDLKLIIEFDGTLHYTKASQRINDIEKDEIASTCGYTLVRIPYFVQFDLDVVQYYLGEYVDINSLSTFEFMKYPQGFHDTCAYPADFCELGQHRFIEELTKLPQSCKNAIIENLLDLCTKHTKAAIIFNKLNNFINI